MIDLHSRFEFEKWKEQDSCGDKRSVAEKNLIGALDPFLIGIFQYASSV